ncbi:hypothetical protein SteCoe_21457 [Stentor coeruleus]|uniref:non-specific serine/threonine protein kinase n=1 Tax=Stentor coeruleus TaxID=5963 RepID=A0A1R2BPK2_9CILI|nr:hypothetical protein SteCoe_21457 [Stentor coeruleus]
MEYADSGDLLQRIQSCVKRKTKFIEKTIWAIFIQITKGLQSLHDLDVLHRDIKSANVFMNKDGSVKLGDLNISKVTKDGFLKTQTGTPFYASPEVWKDQKYNKKSDIWSLGCVLYEMCTLKPPFNGRDSDDLFLNIIAGRLDPIPRQYSKDLVTIIRALLKVNPADRPNCHEILEMECVLKNYEDFSPKIRFYNLLEPIKLPKELVLLSSCLPRPSYADSSSVFYNMTHRNHSKKLENTCGDYKNSNNDNRNINGQIKLPTLKSQQQLIVRNKIIHKYIENPSEIIKKLQNQCINANTSLASGQLLKPYCVTQKKSPFHNSPH